MPRLAVLKRLLIELTSLIVTKQRLKLLILRHFHFLYIKFRLLGIPNICINFNLLMKK
jgi:hypothetical protein